MEYWNTLITEKSWNVLQKIKKEINFILIGGWATYLWCKSYKSKDIDIVIDFKELEKLKIKYNLKKNDSLKKYEIIIDDIDIDVYVPFYSKLPLIENLKNYTSKVEGFTVVIPEVLLILKQSAELNRSHSEKGLKDRIDIMDLLLKCDIDFRKYDNLLGENKLKEHKKRLRQILTSFKEIKYLNLNPREFKLKKKELINRLSK